MLKVKILFSICALLATSLVSAQTWSLGGAAIYGDDIGEPGIHARGYFNSKNGKTCFGPEFSRFIKSTETINGHEVSKQLSEVNFNLHYIIELKEEWGFYPLIGLNMSFEKEEIKDDLGEVEVESKDVFGANLGAGIHRMGEKWIFFAEYDHLFSDLSQNSYLIGAFYTFGKTTEHE
ncbi:MAG: hypothetical protein ABJF04_23290 [Reichenbachiella sp.]|uniref:hypothetical protein n=1 Tax=Reichenbachiella sp. TaxID=2184521 RepID=UPI003262F5B2